MIDIFDFCLIYCFNFGGTSWFKSNILKCLWEKIKRNSLLCKLLHVHEEQRFFQDWFCLEEEKFVSGKKRGKKWVCAWAYDCSLDRNYTKNYFNRTSKRSYITSYFEESRHGDSLRIYLPFGLQGECAASMYKAQSLFRIISTSGSTLHDMQREIQKH